MMRLSAQGTIGTGLTSLGERHKDKEMPNVQVRVQATEVTFSDGTEVVLPPNGVVLLVGPNNAGKSQTLEDLVGLARGRQYVGRALSNVDFVKHAEGDITDWVCDNVPQVSRNGISRFQVDGWGEVGCQDIVNEWSAPTPRNLTSLFVLHADGTSRLTAGDSQPSIDFSNQVPAHPVQRAYYYPRIEDEINKESVNAFGLGVTVDRYAGSVISLRLGDNPHFAHNNGLPTDDYLSALRALPKLEEQGDGVRSYLGLTLHLAAGGHQILLIDEPEAFLHPPQAHRLGSVLASKARTQQVLIATHSTDVLQGALEGVAPVTIVRVTREGNLNHPAVLDDVAVKKLWSDPLLRYSNVLDGLFNDAVVVCESDADCRYYSSVLDNLPVGAVEYAARREPQFLFTHCGGKARLASVAEALRAVSVPVIVVADFDVLRNASDVKAIVSALGGDYAAYEADLKLVASALESDVKPLRKVALRDEIFRRLDVVPNEVIDRKDAEALRAIIKVETGWDKAKRSGMQALPQGDAYAACGRLLSGLRSAGLHVVPVGELERFVPEVAGHGPSWVSTVLGNNLHVSPGRDATEFVRGIRNAVTI